MSGLLVLDEAGGEHRHLALTFRELHLGALLEPGREALLGVRRKQADRRHAGDLLDGFAHAGAGLGIDDLVGDGARGGGERSEQIGAPHHLGGRLVSGDLMPFGVLHGVGTQHQAREVEVPLVQLGNVRAVDVAELALEALVDDLVLLGRCQASGVLVVVFVDHLEQRRERGAELETETTSVTQVVDPGQFLANIRLVEVDGILRVIRRCHELPRSRVLRSVRWGRHGGGRRATPSHRVS